MDSTQAHPAAAEHEDNAGGWLRPAVFGVSDGLVSNAALLLGVIAGGADAPMTLLAGASGLLAGAFSMAAGEWVSVQADREATEREIAREREHHRRFPEAEADHMRQLLAEAGLSPEVAERLVNELSTRPEENLGFHTRLELGVDPRRLPRPGLAAISSFIAFALGALVPMLPFLWPGGAGALGGPISAALSALALFLVGAALSRFTKRPPLRSGLRQLFIGALAAAVTMALGAALPA